MNPLERISTGWLVWLLVPLMALGGVRAHFCGCGDTGSSPQTGVETAREMRSCCAQEGQMEQAPRNQGSCCNTKGSCPLDGPAGEHPDHCNCLTIGCETGVMHKATSLNAPVIADLEPSREDPLSLITPYQSGLASLVLRNGQKRSPGRPLFVAFCSFRC